MPWARFLYRFQMMRSAVTYSVWTSHNSNPVTAMSTPRAADAPLIGEVAIGHRHRHAGEDRFERDLLADTFSGQEVVLPDQLFTDEPPHLDAITSHDHIGDPLATFSIEHLEGRHAADAIRKHLATDIEQFVILADPFAIDRRTGNFLVRPVGSGLMIDLMSVEADVHPCN